MTPDIKPRLSNRLQAQELARIVAISASDLTLDANDLTAVFARELEFVDQRLMEEKFAPLKAEELIDYDARGGAGVDQATWRKVTELGNAEFIGDGTTTLPVVDAVGSEYTRQVKSLGAAWSITVQDLRRVAESPSIHIDVAKKKAAQNAIRRLHDKTAMIGNTALGWTGLVNDANVPLVTPITGDWLNPATTELQILADVNKLSWAPYIATKENYEVDTLLIPTSAGLRFDAPIGTDANKTLRAFILANSPHIKKIETTHHLETASAGTGIRAMVYRKSKEILLYGANDTYSEEQPQRKGLNIETPAHGRSSGLQVFQPLAMAYMDID